MRVIITIQHPAHVHFFKNAIRELERTDHTVAVFAREKDIAIELLEAYGIEHTVLAGRAEGVVSLAGVQLRYELGLLRAARRFRPDVLVAIGEPGVVHVSKLLGSKSVVFTDTEGARFRRRLVYPFADRVCVPDCYREEISGRCVRYPGYHELAYLHPNRFDPDPSVPEAAGVEANERFAVIRSVSWEAMHDIGDSGFSDIRDAVSRIEATGTRVLITAEAPLPNDLEPYQVSVPAQDVHHLLYYADVFVGESATMATESAVLGTPAVFVSSSTRGYTDELERRYGLVFNFHDERRHDAALRKAVSILDATGTDWEARRERLLSEKVDTTGVILREALAYR
jgi:uncharacterized protein